MMTNLLFLLLFQSSTTLTLTVTVSAPLDPREVTQTQAECVRVDSTTDVCTVTDGLSWVEVLQCNARQCIVLERWEDLW